MKIIIDEQVCKDNNMSMQELLAVLLVRVSKNIPHLFNDMVKKQVFVQDGAQYLITQRWSEVADTIILDSDNETQSVDRLDNLVNKLQEVFPQGKKEGTSQYWRGNKREITLRLKKFFKLHGNTYTDEQLIDAAETYVHGYNGMYKFMRVLKYFIWKDERRTMEDGEIKVIEVSDMANHVENGGEHQTLKEDWMSTLN